MKRPALADDILSIVDGNSPIRDNCWKLLELEELR